MKNADKFVVGGLVYDVLSPATFGDYMETIGSACINPDGYAENKLFLAYDDNVQKLFRATAAIAYSELLIKDTNCEPTTMAEALANALSAGGVSYDNTDSGLTASNVQDAIDEVNGDVETVNSDLSNEISARAELGAHNIFDFEGWYNKRSISYTKTGNSYETRVDGVLYVNPWQFSDVDIPVTLSATIVNGTAVYPRMELLKADGTLVGAIDSSTQSFSGTGAKIRENFSTAGTWTVTEPMVRLASDKDSTYQPYAKTNRELTENVENAKRYRLVASTNSTSETWAAKINRLYSAYQSLSDEERATSYIRSSTGTKYSYGDGSRYTAIYADSATEVRVDSIIVRNSDSILNRLTATGSGTSLSNLSPNTTSNVLYLYAYK